MKLFALFVFFAISIEFTIGQTLPVSVDFKSPEVAAFNRNIETPVSYYTGVPNISIPIYQINAKGITVPISLNYHAGGIRVDQEATWVGLGWSLDYGGEISRKVRGISDERQFFTHSSVDSFMAMPASTAEDRELRQEQIAMAKYGALPVDFMPDEFYYSCQGYSGRFMFNQSTKKFVLFPKEDISVNPGPFIVGSGDPFPYWTLQLPNGASADFGKDAVTSQSNSGNVFSNNRSSWLIKCIRNGRNDSIVYNYESYSYDAWKIMGENFTIGGGGAPSDNLNTAVQKLSYQDQRVKEIDFPNGKMTFISSPRSDMPTNALTEIDVTNNAGLQIRKILFYYSYFTGSSFDILPTINSIVNGNISTDYKYKRLKLDSVQITGSSEQPMTYRFDYYSNGQMPSKYSFAQDHFGFYNGQSNTGIYSFIPNIYPPSTESSINGFQGGDRRVNPALCNTFSLHSITYPEGGKTEYVYENNTANLDGIPKYLLNSYQDDNIRDTFANISFSGFSRSSFFPSPDSVATDGTKYFIRNFTVSNNGYPAVGLGWAISCNYGISTAENNTPYNADNVYFKLEAIDALGTATLMKDFSTIPVPPSSGPPYLRTGTDNSALQLRPGNYRMTVKIIYANPVGSPAENQPHGSYFRLYYRELDTSKMMVNVGGLRIKTMNYYKEDGTLALKKSFSYNYLSPNAYNIANYTSGRIVSLPKYYQYANQIGVSITNPTTCSAGFYLKCFSNSILPLETTAGSYAGYESVDEYDVSIADTTQTLRTNYSFSFKPSYFAVLNPAENLAMWEPQEWERGKMFSKKSFKGNAIVKQEDYSYYSLSPNQSVEDNVPEINTDFISWQSLIANNPQFVIDFNENPEDPRWGPLNPNTYPPDFYDNAPSYFPISNVTNAPVGNVNCPTYYYDNSVHVPYFLHYTGFDKPMAKTVTFFDDNGGVLSNIDSFFYEASPNYYQLTRTKALSSKGDTLETSNKYPFDYATTSPYSAMISQHNLNALVETQRNKNGTLLETQHMNYADWGNNIFSVSSVQTRSIYNSTWDTRAATYGFDSKGNVLEESKSSDKHVSYIWDYNKQYPIAQVDNASQSDIAYTSFEADGTGSWTIGNASKPSGGITGDLYYTLASDISRSGLSTGTTYVVSYWTDGNVPFTIPGTVSGFPIQGRSATINGVKWTFYEHKVTGQSTVTINGTGNIDELRLYPKDAQMTSYTYVPLIGMTSQCNINNQINYYKYDGLGRLQLIKDQDGNVIKTIDYHFQGQQSN
jgi:hypothetical protein